MLALHLAMEPAKVQAFVGASVTEQLSRLAEDLRPLLDPLVAS